MLFLPKLALGRKSITRGWSNLTVKPDIAVSPAQAQTIVDRLGAGQTVAGISKLQGGAIGAIYEIGLIGGAPSSCSRSTRRACTGRCRRRSMSAHCCQISSACRCRASSLPTTRSRSSASISFSWTSWTVPFCARSNRRFPIRNLFSAYAQMGQVLRQIHRISMPGFGYVGPNGIWTAHASNRAYMSAQFETKLAEFAERGDDRALGDRLRAVVIERLYSSGCVHHTASLPLRFSFRQHPGWEK